MPDPSPDTPSLADGQWVCAYGIPVRGPITHATPTAPGSPSPDTAALVERLHDITRSIWRGGEFHYQLVLEQCGDIVAAADALEAQAARITELEAAVAERNSLIGWLIMAKSCADHGQAPVWPLPAQLEELFQQLSVSVRDDWDDWRWRGITPADHTPSPPPTEETTE